jgi:type VI secretion system protein VasG
MQHCHNPAQRAPDMPALKQMLTPVLQQRFKPAFLGRLQVVPFYPINDETMRLIIRLKLDRLQARMRANRRIALVYSEALVDAVAARCTEVDSGARNVDHILNDALLPELSRRMLEKMAAEERIDTIHVTVGPQGFEFAFNPPPSAAGAEETDELAVEVN